ncbi:peptidoglycan-binding protein [Dolichospermum sp. UHCC 0259]|nr:peptidoglycan-binding protein [Dolichospermum sp. UHCC 0259]
MMGVLNQKPLNIPHFPSQKIFPIENSLGLTNHQSNKLAVYPQIIPPEFTHTGIISLNHLSILSFRRQKIFEQITQKQMSVSSFEIADAGNIPITKRRGIPVSTRYPRTQNQPMPVISFGSSGISVRALQKLLIANGYGITIDGVFGPVTETAVKAFQNRRRLSTDGIVGQKTWWELTM